MEVVNMSPPVQHGKWIFGVIFKTAHKVNNFLMPYAKRAGKFN